MEVQYVGYQEKGEGKIIFLLEEIKTGMRPILVRSKYGLTSTYVSNILFEQKLSSVRPGDYIEIEFNRYGGVMFK